MVPERHTHRDFHITAAVATLIVRQAVNDRKSIAIDFSVGCCDVQWAESHGRGSFVKKEPLSSTNEGQSESVDSI
ncbi:hypothetical protein ZHAS_00013477 [Anopheles sinensis]|uniref:Uncharacterized protein n=1 Tax=Anopheles sinensis TaxID=74873 RepID=A0A084W5N7_ANOSI|nr:hypothetical protein ZHAS_00013477 [Anopheles sinensis]